MNRFFFTVLALATTLVISQCHTKQKLSSPIEDSVKVDTVIPMQTYQPVEEKTVYDSSSAKHFMFKNLSRQFDIALDIKRFTVRNDIHDSCMVKATIFDKSSNKIFDSVFITSVFFYTNYYDIPSHMVSYSTDAHIFKQPVDNYVGDLVVSDLNFDDKDDVVLINDMGGNGGPLYSYFIQQPSQKFVLNRYLTDSMSYFPDVDKKRKTLTTYVHAGACCVGRQIYRLNSKTQEWKLVEHVILGLPKKNSKS